MRTEAPAIARLIEALSKFPGVGEKTAERLAYFILRAQPSYIHQLVQAIQETREKVKLCKQCFNVTESQPCSICADEKRNRKLLLVVERPADLDSIENTGDFAGLYHVLHGAISPIEGSEPKNLKVAELVDRLIKGSPINELIIGTNHNVEGDATAHFLTQVIQKRRPDLKVTRLASGLPIGGALKHADHGTLSRALRGRAKFG